MEPKAQKGLFGEDLAGTKTEQNLHTALSGEAQAYLRYQWFEKKAKDDGYVEIAQLFRDTASNEKEHAELWFKYLGGREGTERNLEVAASGERFEWESMYSEFEQTAREEGFSLLADLFARVASVEKHHEQNYRKQLERVQNGTVFTSESTDTKWICLNCGYIVSGKEPPKTCPTCFHAQGYFKEYREP